MKDSIDARQTKEWGEYLSSLGWRVERVDEVQVFIRRLPLFGGSIIKVQHPQGPIPFSKIEKIARQNKALFVVIEPHIVGFNKKDYEKNGFNLSKMFFAHTATIKIDLTQSEKSLLSSFSENARRNIRKSQKSKLTIKKIEMKKFNKKAFDEFYQLLKNVGKMKKFYVPSYDEYFKKMSAFKNKSFLLFAYQKNLTSKNPIAVVWFAGFRNVLAYFQTGITDRGYETLANYLLVWEGLKIGKRKGYAVFDFESVYDPRFPKERKRTKNYSEFKRRFHGELVEYPQPYIKFYSWWFKSLYKLSTLFS